MEKNDVGVVRKGAWTPEEDILLRKCIHTFGEGKWHLVPIRAGTYVIIITFFFFFKLHVIYF